MMRAYTFLSLLIITGMTRPLSFAQQPVTQSPTSVRQSFVAEELRRRLSPPSIEPTEEPILRIKTVVYRPPDPKAGLGKPNPFLKDLSGLYGTALFQRQRFRETGQPIEFERGNLYFRQDRYVATKGIILYRLCSDRIDLGIYQRAFHGEASPGRGQAMWFRQADPLNREHKSNDGRQYFFGLRFRLDKPPQRSK
ncbi:MAG TPA: hypothetical protein VKE91_12370 [Blastocatellia bacterium]|nr:hypothetical protein [Blastocatellia bacterium]